MKLKREKGMKYFFFLDYLSDGHGVTVWSHESTWWSLLVNVATDLAVAQ